MQNNVERNDGVNIFYDFRFSFVRNKKYCLKSCSYHFPFCVICSLKSTNVPLAGHICAISRHFAGISIFEKRITQNSLHPSSIPWNPLCLLGFQREKGTISPFITLHLFTFFRFWLTDVTSA